MTSQFSDMTSLSNFLTFFLSFVKFSYWSKCHVNIITGSGVMIISFYEVLTKNPEIGNTPVWVLHNIWRLGRVKNTKFGTNVSNKILINAAKCQGCTFYHFWVINRKLTGEVKLTPCPPRLGLRTPYFTEHHQWLFLTVSGFSSASLLKKNSQKDVFLWILLNF